MKKLISLLMAIIMIMALCVCGQTAAFAEKEMKPIVIKFSSTSPASDPMTLYNQEMCDYITEKSGGLIQFEMYANGELGSMSDVTEMVQRGANVMTWVGGDFFVSVAPEMAILNMQYCLSDASQIQKIEESEWFKEQCDLVYEGANTKILTWNWFTGYRHMISNFPINSPDDIVGKKMRVVDNLALPAFATALDCAPVVTIWNEVYTGLSNKLIDIAESPLASFYSSSLFEVADHVAITNHLTSVNMMILPRSLYDSLTPELQDLFMEASKIYGEKFSQASLDGEAEYKQLLEEKGMIFTYPEISEFQAKASRMYANIGYEEMYEKIQDLLK